MQQVTKLHAASYKTKADKEENQSKHASVSYKTKTDRKETSLNMLQ